MHLIQFIKPDGERAVGTTQADLVLELRDVRTVYELARRALAASTSLDALAEELLTAVEHDFDRILSEKRILPPLDHPDPAHLFVTGTGLTHLGSAKMRQELHQKLSDPEQLTDSMKMFQLGVEGGKPPPGQIGVQPEWFYKGNGANIISPEAELPQPGFALDGGEEVEICGLYVIDDEGRPRRLGFSLGNEFSDHVTENQNYLYLAHSKLRCCSFGPELRTGELPPSIEGTVRILREGSKLWEAPFLTGEENMSHSLANLEHHHFKYAQFRQPGDVHIHYFGTGTASYAHKVRTQDGDLFSLECPLFGRPLRNALRHDTAPDALVEVKPL